MLANPGVCNGVQDVPGRTGGEYLPIDDDHPVEPLRRTIEVVGCHEDRQPAADPLAYQREQNLFGRRIDARRRLVEEQDARLLRERARDERPLLLSARELRDVPTREAAQPQRFYRRIDDLAIVRSEAFPRTQVRKPAHRDDVPHAHREAPSTSSPCGTYPTFPGGKRRGRFPKTSMIPAAGSMRPATALRSVDFPEPFGPTIPSASPSFTRKSTSSSAVTEPKRTVSAQARTALI